MIVVEGNHDELLMKTMGFPRKLIHIAGCKGKVLKKIRDFVTAVGIIDEDPNSEQPGEIKQYEVIDKKGTILLRRKKADKSKALIQISPDFENWILRRAKINKINPTDFSVPNTPGELHRLTRIKQNRKFIDFLTRVIAADDEIKTIKKWINEVLKV